MMGHVDVLQLLIEVGLADINATDEVSHITVSYELFSFKYDILIRYSKLIPTCLIPRLPIISNILIKMKGTKVPNLTVVSKLFINSMPA